MKQPKNKKKIIAFTVLGLTALVGSYNAVVINSESAISTDVHLVKKLEELNGVIIKGREVATSSWKKLSVANVTKSNSVLSAPTSPVFNSTPEKNHSEPTPAVVQDDLNLSLVEVINPKKWQRGLSTSEFSGNISASNGVIESLSVALPDGESVNVSFAEMTGNNFEYDLNGRSYSGMMYQVDQNGYMVTLTNGPLEGTRLRFSSNTPAEERINIENQLANSNIEVGSFGSADVINQNDKSIQEESMAQGFNLDQDVL